MLIFYIYVIMCCMVKYLSDKCIIFVCMCTYWFLPLYDTLFSLAIYFLLYFLLISFLFCQRGRSLWDNKIRFTHVSVEHTGSQSYTRNQKSQIFPGIKMGDWNCSVGNTTNLLVLMFCRVRILSYLSTSHKSLTNS